MAVQKSGLTRSCLVVGLLVVIYVLLNFATNGRFLTRANMLSVLTGSVVSTFIVLGFCFIIKMGIMDLSLGAIMILASNAGGILAVNYGLGYFGLIPGAVVVAVALLLLNMLLIQLTKIPPWIFGLGIAMVYETIGTIYNVRQINAGKQAVALGKVCRELGVPPWNFVVLAAGLALAYIVFNRTSTGFALRAIGSNGAVAKMMGINVNRVMLLSGLVAGVFVGLAAAVNISYGGKVVPVTGLNSIAIIFMPLAAYLLSEALSGLFNIIPGAVISAFIITSIFNVLTLLGVPSGTWQQVVMGASVLICGVLSQRRYEGVVK